VPRRRERKKFKLLPYVILFITVSLASTFIFSLIKGATSANVNSVLSDKIRKDLLTERSRNDEPLNILIIGSDSRNGEAARSDTLILMHVDFQKNKVYFLSIPRDTRVYISGQGIAKINAAFSYGQASLAIRTVEQFLNVNLNHYAVIDFQGFKQMVDALGGVTVNVKEPINDRSYGYRMYIPKGKIKMDGKLALNYVRYRHSDSDFKRAERQQNFIKALAKQVLTVKALTKLPTLVNILNDNLETDMSKREMLSLGNYLRTVKDKQIETITVPGEPETVDGQSFVIPDRYTTELIIERMEAGKSLKPLKAKIKEGSFTSERPAYLTVLNGTGKAGLAKQAKQRLIAKGLRVVSTGNAKHFRYRQTEIQFNPLVSQKAKELQRLFFITAKLVPNKQLKKESLIVILGQDYLLTRWQ
jgi:LCP family protein required for cell wall assembly